jgi:mono/diheme cytochrome c family protein
MKRYIAPVICLFVIALIGSWAGAQAGNGRPMRGQAIYDEYCARCHGLTGKGDGPDAASLLVPPANFLTARSRAKTDFELLTIISYGIAFSPMHGWNSRLTDAELLEVVAYLRTLAPFIPDL